MAITLSKLRCDLFHYADEVLKTGKPLDIKRKNRTLILAPADPIDKLSAIKPLPSAYEGNLDEIINMDWSNTWKPFI